MPIFYLNVGTVSWGAGRSVVGGGCLLLAIESCMMIAWAGFIDCNGERWIWCTPELLVSG